jgi:DMSO reductase anchor subunit
MKISSKVNTSTPTSPHNQLTRDELPTITEAWHLLKIYSMIAARVSWVASVACWICEASQRPQSANLATLQKFVWIFSSQTASHLTHPRGAT